MNTHTLCLSSRKLVCAAALAVGMSAGPASANVIDFSTLLGNNGSSFFSLQEDGFEVTVFGINAINEWQEDHSAGNALPSIGSPIGPTDSEATIAQLTVTKIGGGDFTFDSVDLAGTGSHTFLGFLNGAEVFNFGEPHIGNFVTFLGSSTVVDELRISLVLDSALNEVDNIRLSVPAQVPEPGSIALFGAGLGLLGLLRRRTRA